jgi:hypothetical protein
MMPRRKILLAGWLAFFTPRATMDL